MAIIIWGTENPNAYIEMSSYPKRVTLWYGFWSRGIIAPFFFENEQGEAVTVNGDRYRAILNNLREGYWQPATIDALKDNIPEAICEIALVCWLIRRKARVRVPGQTLKRNTKSISSEISSQQISGKNSESK